MDEPPHKKRVRMKGHGSGWIEYPKPLDVAPAQLEDVLPQGIITRFETTPPPRVIDEMWSLRVTRFSAAKQSDKRATTELLRTPILSSCDADGNNNNNVGREIKIGGNYKWDGQGDRVFTWVDRDAIDDRWRPSLRNAGGSGKNSQENTPGCSQERGPVSRVEKVEELLAWKNDMTPADAGALEALLTMWTTRKSEKKH
eukprot:PhF_6_TR6370/c0_g1_i1/m.9626